MAIRPDDRRELLLGSTGPQGRADRHILLTNDDGFWAEGLTALRRALLEHFEVIVVAPDREQSATSHSLTLHHPLRVTRVEEGVYSVNGTPSDCVTLAVRGLLDRPPDLVVSGINHGSNLGDDVTYSGTVAAAMEGTLMGIPSIAVSLAGVGTELRFDGTMDLQFDAAAEFACRLAGYVLRVGMPEDTLLNVNVPNLPKDQIRGVRITRMGRRVYREAVIQKTDPRGKPYYWIGGEEPTWFAPDGSDFAAVESRMVSITPLHLDLTNYRALEELARWEIGW